MRLINCFGLGVTTLATSKLIGATRGGGTKGFFKQIGTGIATPFKAIGKRFNPQLASRGNQENKRNTEDFAKIKEESLNKKLNKVSSGKMPKNTLGVSFENPQNKKEMKINKNITKLSNKFPKLQYKQTKINDKLKNHKIKQNIRTKKWDEKEAKKQEKKKNIVK